jgi:glucose 1-dehydrogenase
VLSKALTNISKKKNLRMQRLKKQVALVTGASSGIGKEIAIEMAKEGAKVVVNFAHREEGARETVDEIHQNGGEAIAVKADVSREEEVKQMVGKAVETFGTIDILVNNAGVQKDNSLLDMSLEDWEQVIGVNLTGQFLCAREVVREFLRRGLQEERSRAVGKIICISSVHEKIPWGGRINYAASKGGVKLLMESLAQELGPRRIRVNSIAPGAIKTAINEKEWKEEQGRKKMIEKIPYGRIGEPADIARVAVWLASDDADYITGTTIFVDGAMTNYPSFLEQD